MSSITLYKDCKIIPSKNFVVEEIESYLTGLTQITISNFQYLRNDLKLSIKIDKEQVYSESLATYNYNYLKVVQNSVNYYYFIIKKTQIAQSTVVLELVLDTLNTYPWGTAFTISNRTRVKREHKDRMKYNLNSYYAIRLIDVDLDDMTIENNTDYTCNMICEYNGDTKKIVCNLYFYYVLTPIGAREFRISGISEADLKWLATHSSAHIRSFVSISDPDKYVSFAEPLPSVPQELPLLREIDYYSEGITPPLYKTDHGKLIHKEDSTWNLIYRNNENDADAIDCYCIPDKELKANNITEGELEYTDFEDGKHYLIMPFKINDEYVKPRLVSDSGRNFKVTLGNSGGFGRSAHFYDINRNGSQLRIRAIDGLLRADNKMVVNVIYGYINVDSLSFSDLNLYYKVVDSIAVTNEITNTYTSSFTTTGNSEVMSSLGDIDRVDPKLIKIISIPYFPTEYSFDGTNDTITTDSEWAYSGTGEIKGFLLNDLNTHFLSTIDAEGVANPLRKFGISRQFNLSATRNDENESKIFHSDFYQPKFVYDSFGFVFELEKYNTDYYSSMNKGFVFEFIMTSTINSKFLFRFPDYILKMSTIDYDNILPIARNNEAPIYNSSYVTYLRTAYRYDLKNLQYKGSERAVNFALNSGKTTIGVVGDVMSKEYMGAVSKVLSYIGSVSSMEFSAMKEYNSLDAKMEQLKNQANSVSGSDDLDLLEAYTDNRPKLVVYKVSERMEKLLLDLFYYYGYSTDEIKIPATNTRYWFNFLSCELELTGVCDNISEISKMDLINRYNEGATFLHKRNGEWDFAQTKENWEVSLL